MVLLRAHAPALADLDGHRAADHVARRQVLHARRVALHEALAVGIAQDAAFAAHALGDQAAGAVDAGRVELHELHVLQRQARAQRHAAAVAGTGMRRGGGEIGAAVAAGGQHRALGAEQVQRAVAHVDRQHAAAGALGIHDQVEREILDEELGVVRQRLLVERVQDGVAGAVGGGASALRRRALAVLRGHAAEGALVDLAFLGARERHAVVLELDDRGDRLAAHVLDRVLVAQPVRTLDGVEEVVAPVVLAHVAERGGDAALRRDGVRAGREHLADAGGRQALLRQAEGGAQAGAAGADDQHVVLVFGDRIGGHAQAQAAKYDAADGQHGGDRAQGAGETDEQLQRDFQPAVDVIFDHHLHAELRVPEQRQQPGHQQRGVERLADQAAHFVLLGAKQAEHQGEEPGREQQQRGGGHPLQPPVAGAALRRAQAARGRQRVAQRAHAATPPDHASHASAAVPSRLSTTTATPVALTRGISSPQPISQSRCRTPLSR